MGLSMARYRVTRPTFLQASRSCAPQLFEVGAIVEFDGVPGSSLEPLDEAASAAKEAAAPRFEILPNGVQVRERATGRLKAWFV
jgi:hypothetical protein